MFALAAAIMVAANVIADVRDPLNGAMHGVVPVVAMAVWHVVIHGRPAIIKARSPRARSAQVNVRSASTAARTRRLLKRSPTVSSAEAAERLGVSQSHARRLLAEARKPRVVGEAER